MGRVCSMESKATWYLTYTRPPCRDESGKDYLISPLLERERLVARSGKKRLVCIPTLPRYLLKEPPRGQPSPVIRPKQHGKIAASTSTSKKYRYLYLSGPITPQKSPTTASTRNFFLPDDQPTSQHMSFRKIHYLISDMHYAYYKANTYIESPIELYSDSTSSTSGHSQALLANLFGLSFTS